MGAGIALASIMGVDANVLGHVLVGLGALSAATVTRRSSKGFLILLLKLLILLIFALYGIWEDLGAWKVLLWAMPMVCLQF